MKKFKIVLGAFTACLLIAALGLSALAAPQTVDVGTGSGKITVTNATVGKDYRLYKLFDATYNSGGDVAYSYTKAGASDPLYDLLVSAGSPFTLTQILGGDSYNVTTSATADEISNWIKANLDVNAEGELVDGAVLAAIATAAPATDSVVEFANLAYGYYFITSSLGTTVTIDSNTPEVSVIDKNQGPSWDIDESGTGKVITSDSNKDYDPPVTENTVNVGDTVSFKIGVNTTNYNGDKKVIEYFVRDTLGKGFAYDKTSLKVFIGTTELALSAGTPAAGSEYSVEWDDADNGFKITVPWYDEAGDVFASENANNTVTVTYDATLVDNSDIVYAGAGNKNKASYDFRDESDTTPSPDPYHIVDEKETTTYTFALALIKIDSKTKEPLAGAEFKIKNSAGEYLTATGSNGVYLYSGTTTDESLATAFAVGTNGQLLVKGVAEGDYSLVESKAPDGYNMLTGEIPLSAQIASASTYTETYTTYFDADGNIVGDPALASNTLTRTYEVNAAELIIENTAGTTLPETGGTGTKIFYIVGALLAFGAVVALVARKRVKRDDE